MLCALCSVANPRSSRVLGTRPGLAGRRCTRQIGAPCRTPRSKIAAKRPIFKEYEEINTQLQIFASQLTAGELTPQETIDGLAAELNAIMQAGGYQQ